MRKVVLIALSLVVSVSAFSQQTQGTRPTRRGQAAGYATRDATVMSMMGWGLGLGVGIAALCALIDNQGAPTSTNH